MLSILLLGQPQVTLFGQPLDLPRRKSRALLYYLAGHTAPLARDHLLAFFWPDHDRAAAQQVLRTTLHGLRKVLGESLVADEHILALAPNVEVDARAFTTSISPAHVRPGPPALNLQSLLSTLSLYRGDFLASFS